MRAPVLVASRLDPVVPNSVWEDAVLDVAISIAAVTRCHFSRSSFFLKKKTQCIFT